MIHVLFARKTFRTKVSGYGDDADTDSYSDSDFDGAEDIKRLPGNTEEREKVRNEEKSLELLEKR